MSKNAYKKLFNNSLIFGLGEIGSKGITLLLVPLYTFYLTQSEYGMVDLIQITINLIVPIISLSIFEAVLRFVMDDSEDIPSIFTNGFLITCISSLFILAVTVTFYHFGILKSILPYVAAIVILQLFQSLFTQFIRGIGKVALFALNGLLLAISIGCMNLIFVMYLELGIQGYLLSLIMGLTISLLHLSIYVKPLQYFKLSSISLKLSKNLLNYSTPLMPNALMWWIINASSRYFILIFAGAASNGLFAVASKIPSILSIFNSIFFKAWQLSAIEEYKSENKSFFYSKVFKYYQQFLFIVVALILLFLKPLFTVAIGSSFYSSWRYVPFLLVAVLFSSFSSFLGTNYIAAKETKGVFKTSIVGGTTNLSLNIITIPLIGVIGASFSSMISFFVMTVMRWHDTKKYIEIQYDYRNFFANLALVFIQILIMFLNLGLYVEFVCQLAIVGVLIIINKMIIKNILKFILKRQIRNKGSL